MKYINIRRLLTVATLIVAATGLALAQNGTMKMKVLPEESYIFVDGQPMIHRSNTLTLPVGEHTIAVYNYGHVPFVQKFHIEQGTNPEMDVRLSPEGSMVSGPWGRIQIEGVHGDTLVFLNDTKPEFFVAHADEANNNFLNKQQLIVPVGTHKLFLVNNLNGQTIWSGPVEVRENQRLILYTDHKPNGEIVYKDWAEGAKIASLKRFEASTATATIAVAPVKGKLMASPETIHCDQPVHLSWTSTDAARTTVMSGGTLLSDKLNGELTLTPKQTTNYEFNTIGPGGSITTTTTVHVDNTVKTTLTPSSRELRFVKVGNKVMEQETANLNWTALNADSVHIEPFGAMTGTSGMEKVVAMPKKTTDGTVDETQLYRITATNACGGSDTSVASLHLTGSIGPEQVAEVKPEELPETASQLPLLALLGTLSLGSAAALRLVRKLRG